MAVERRDSNGGRHLHSGRIDVAAAPIDHAWAPCSLAGGVDRLVEVAPFGDLVERLASTLASDATLKVGGDHFRASKLRAMWRETRLSSDSGICPRASVLVKCELNEGVAGDQVGPLFALHDGEAFFSSIDDLVRDCHSPFRPYGDPLSSLSIVIWETRGSFAEEAFAPDYYTVKCIGSQLSDCVVMGGFTSPTGHHSFRHPAAEEIAVKVPADARGLDVILRHAGGALLDRRVHRDYALLALTGTAGDGLPDTVMAERIAGGEDAQLEIKPWIRLSDDEPKRGELLRTCAAMANGKGGTIVIGVGEDGMPVPTKQLFEALKANSLKKRLPSDAAEYYARLVVDVLRTSLDPIPEVEGRVARLGGQPIVVLEVATAGAARPCMVTPPNGVWIRRNASTRQAAATDIADLTRGQRQGF